MWGQKFVVHKLGVRCIFHDLYKLRMSQNSKRFPFNMFSKTENMQFSLKKEGKAILVTGREGP
jgi:hypothetical protein